MTSLHAWFTITTLSFIHTIQSQTTTAPNAAISLCPPNTPLSCPPDMTLDPVLCTCTAAGITTTLSPPSEFTITCGDIPMMGTHKTSNSLTFNINIPYHSNMVFYINGPLLTISSIKAYNSLTPTTLIAQTPSHGMNHIAVSDLNPTDIIIITVDLSGDGIFHAMTNCKSPSPTANPSISPTTPFPSISPTNIPSMPPTLPPTTPSPTQPGQLQCNLPVTGDYNGQQITFYVSIPYEGDISFYINGATILSIKAYDASNSLIAQTLIAGLNHLRVNDLRANTPVIFTVDGVGKSKFNAMAHCQSAAPTSNPTTPSPTLPPTTPAPTDPGEIMCGSGTIWGDFNNHPLSVEVRSIHQGDMTLDASASFNFHILQISAYNKNGLATPIATTSELTPTILTVPAVAPNSNIIFKIEGLGIGFFIIQTFCESASPTMQPSTAPVILPPCPGMQIRDPLKNDMCTCPDKSPEGWWLPICTPPLRKDKLTCDCIFDPTVQPTFEPTLKPTTLKPTISPTNVPTVTRAPSGTPTAPTTPIPTLPAPIACGARPKAGDFNNNTLHFDVKHVPYISDMQFYINGINWRILKISAVSKSDIAKTVLAETWFAGANYLKIMNVQPNEEIVFTVEGIGSGRYHVLTDCSTDSPTANPTTAAPVPTTQAPTGEPTTRLPTTEPTTKFPTPPTMPTTKMPTPPTLPPVPTTAAPSPPTLPPVPTFAPTAPTTRAPFPTTPLFHITALPGSGGSGPIALRGVNHIMTTQTGEVMCGKPIEGMFSNEMVEVMVKMPYDGEMVFDISDSYVFTIDKITAYDIDGVTVLAETVTSSILRVPGLRSNADVVFKIEGTGHGIYTMVTSCIENVVAMTTTTTAAAVNDGAPCPGNQVRDNLGICGCPQIAFECGGIFVRDPIDCDCKLIDESVMDQDPLSSNNGIATPTTSQPTVVNAIPTINTPTIAVGLMTMQPTFNPTKDVLHDAISTTSRPTNDSFIICGDPAISGEFTDGEMMVEVKVLQRSDVTFAVIDDGFELISINAYMKGHLDFAIAHGADHVLRIPDIPNNSDIIFKIVGNGNGWFHIKTMCASITGDDDDGSVTTTTAIPSIATSVSLPTVPATTLALPTTPITPSPITPSPITPSPVTPSPVTPSPTTSTPTTPAPLNPGEIICDDAPTFGMFNNEQLSVEVRMTYRGDMGFDFRADSVSSIQITAITAYNKLDMVNPLPMTLTDDINPVFLHDIAANTDIIFQVDGTGKGEYVIVTRCTPFAPTLAATTTNPTANPITTPSPTKPVTVPIITDQPTMDHIPTLSPITPQPSMPTTTAPPTNPGDIICDDLPLIGEFNNQQMSVQVHIPYHGDMMFDFRADTVSDVQITAVTAYDSQNPSKPLPLSLTDVLLFPVSLFSVSANTDIIFKIDGTGNGQFVIVTRCVESTSTTTAAPQPVVIDTASPTANADPGPAPEPVFNTECPTILSSKMDIIVLVDNSCGHRGNLCRLRQSGISELIATINPDYARFAYIDFADQDHIDTELSLSWPSFSLTTDINNFGCGTCGKVPISDIEAGINAATQEFSSNARTNRKRKIILFTNAINIDSDLCSSEFLPIIVDGEPVELTIVNIPCEHASADFDPNQLKCLIDDDDDDDALYRFIQIENILPSSFKAVEAQFINAICPFSDITTTSSAINDDDDAGVGDDISVTLMANIPTLSPSESNLVHEIVPVGNCGNIGDDCTSAVEAEQRCCDGGIDGTTRCKFYDWDMHGHKLGVCCIKENHKGCGLNEDCCGESDVCTEGFCLEPAPNDQNYALQISEDGNYAEWITTHEHEGQILGLDRGPQVFIVVLIVMCICCNLIYCYLRYGGKGYVQDVNDDDNDHEEVAMDDFSGDDPRSLQQDADDEIEYNYDQDLL